MPAEDEQRESAQNEEGAFGRAVGTKERRKERARREGKDTILFGLGMFGMVGWSVAIPTLAGIALGVWIDATFESPYSWTLTLMFVGVILGCVNAWYWVKMYSRTRD